MDWTTLDVSDVDGVSVGDEVVLIGQQGDECVLAEDLAAAIGTISYEITCGIDRRVPRFYSGLDV
jgi:alanine racemase